MTNRWHNSLVLRQNGHQLSTLIKSSNLISMTVVPKLGGMNNSVDVLTSFKNVTTNLSTQDSTTTISQPESHLPSKVLVKNSMLDRNHILKDPHLLKPHGRILSNNSLVSLKLVKGSQYLDERIKQLYLSCRPKVRKGTDTRVFGQCKNVSDMHFINGSRVVALPSYPGSGNTWTRMLLEQTTGIYTGSIYCDAELKAKGFLGEKLSSSNVLAVKTHYPNKELFVPYKEYHDPDKFKNVSAAIVIIRNPVDSLVSHWNWKHGGHVSVMKPVLFGRFSS